MKPVKKQDGQGLVEYSLILVLVAVVVIAILTLLGPQVGNVFSRVVNGLGVVATDGNNGSGAPPPPPAAEVTSVQAFRGGANVVVQVTVSENTNVTVVDSQSGQSVGASCDPNCNVTLVSVGPDAGTVTATADGGSSMTDSYPAQN